MHCKTLRKIEALQDVFRRNQEKIAASTRNLKPLYVGQYVLTHSDSEWFSALALG